MRLCICQICVCGRHRCEVCGRDKVPFAKEYDGDLPDTEYRERYKTFGFQPMRMMILPPSGAEWKGSEPPVKLSMTKKDFVPFPIKKRILKRPKIYKQPKGKMALTTTYNKDYYPKRGEPTSKIKVSEPCKDGTMPGTLPGKMEDITTYNRSYTPKQGQKLDKAVKHECTLTEIGKPFTGEGETARCYKPHPLQKREQSIVLTGNLKPEGQFYGKTTHKIDYTPKYQIPERPMKKEQKWKPSKEKFVGDTTHQNDYKCPVPPQKVVSCAPKPAMVKSKGPFEGKSHYKQDYKPHDTEQRELPKWHPSFRQYKKPTAPFEGETIYRTDYEPPPEDVQQLSPSKPQKGNLTIPSGPMEKVTTSMRDYRKQEGHIPTVSFKPEATYEEPKEKFLGRTVTSRDYTPKQAEKAVKIKLSSNLKVGDGTMDDLTMTMKDFQWLALECPAAYIKLFGKDALPQFEFDKTERGHVFFKKLKKPEARKKVEHPRKCQITNQTVVVKA